jgi:hypothetical protein
MIRRRQRLDTRPSTGPDGKLLRSGRTRCFRGWKPAGHKPSSVEKSAGAALGTISMRSVSPRTVPYDRHRLGSVVRPRTANYILLVF